MSFVMRRQILFFCILPSLHTHIVTSAYQSTSSLDYSKNQNEKTLKNQIQSHPDIIRNYFPNREEQEMYEKYRIDYPPREDFVIDMLVNPCGANGTQIGGHISEDESFALGYDCCMNHFGRGEYGFLKFDHDGLKLSNMQVFERRLPAHHNEVLHNIITVDENGVEIPQEYSRRADDHTVIDETCTGFREPYSSCVQNRLKAVKSSYVPACWDHNQTVDATLSCYTPEGRKRPHCMQISYSQNAFISICGGEFTNDERCGSYIEIHRANGSPYDSESTTLADTKIITEEIAGMYTTTIDLNYKGDGGKILCAYQETKIRLGSMVQVIEESPSLGTHGQCCCPKGAYFCPMRTAEEDDGQFVFTDNLERYKNSKIAPCPRIEEEESLFCSKVLGEYDYSDEDSDALEALLGSKKLSYFDHCDEIDTVDKDIADSLYSSFRLDGNYTNKCPYGEAFKSCSGSRTNCFGNDVPFSFKDRIGKVSRLPNDTNKFYGVSFNGGPLYDFLEHQLHIQIPPSNYELWFVQRNRFEKVLQKRKGFQVIWPLCTFDHIHDRYFPFAQLSDDGEVLDALT